MLIESVMSRTVFTADIRETALDVCRGMKSNHAGSAVILDRGRAVGMITERDIVFTLANIGPSIVNLKAGNIMRSPLITMSPRQTLRAAARLLREKRIRRIPVVEKGRLAGIATAGDILRGIQLELVSSSIRTSMLEKEIYRDELTGVFNYKYFKLALDREVKHVREFGGILSILMIDVDFFKQINDTYGHAAGDYVLRRIAALMKSNTGQINVVCRYGGDEFAVISPISDLDRARQRAERFRGLVEKEKFLHNRQAFNVTLSLGVAEWKRSMKTPADLVNAADKALYISKRQGRNRVTVSRESNSRR
jgi:diguanylate cyclase (GGDEF)-like protein